MDRRPSAAFSSLQPLCETQGSTLLPLRVGRVNQDDTRLRSGPLSLSFFESLHDFFLLARAQRACVIHST